MSSPGKRNKTRDHPPTAPYQGAPSIVFYSGKSSNTYLTSAVDEAADQLLRSGMKPDKRVGLFVLVYAKPAKGKASIDVDLAKFTEKCRAAIRTHFDSDHLIRLTPLIEVQPFDYDADGKWVTASWTTWGRLKR